MNGFGTRFATYGLLGLAFGCTPGESENDRYRDPIETRDGDDDNDAGGEERPNQPSDPALDAGRDADDDAGNDTKGDAGNGALHDASAPVDAAANDAGATPSCGTSTWEPGADTTVTLTHGGTERSYRVHVGERVDPTVPARVVVNFHGLNNSPAIQVLFSGMNALADERGFIVVYPQGLNASFNAGRCCGGSSSNAVDDLGFTRAVVADVASKTCVDARRIYATGFSNGGYMSHHVGCLASDLFAAVAPIAGANATEPCTPDRPLPVFALNANTDPVVSYRDGEAGARGWVERNGCTGEPVREQYGSSYCDVWPTCAAGVEVRFCTWSGGTHLWPGARTGVPASPMLLDFFERFTLP